MQLLSIIIPVYNEINTIEKVLNKIDSLVLNDYHKQVIVVDDFSCDGTREYLKNEKRKKPDYIFLFHFRWIQIGLLGLCFDLIKEPGYVVGSVIGLIKRIGFSEQE